RNRHELIIDEESSFDCNPRNNTYYALNKKSVPKEIKFCHVKKFPKKIMVWIAISRRGISTPYFVPDSASMNMKRYSRFCVTNRLSKFINKHHKNSKYVFWPDNASCHYGSVTLQTLEKLNIAYVPKSHNPANVPHLRPIERFWALLKQKVYSDGFVAENLNDLKRRIISKLKLLDITVVNNLMNNLESKIRKAACNGPDSIL
ncbi:uncharacterized protein B4U80_08044, partial [Leptotrombidium deliense]